MAKTRLTTLARDNLHGRLIARAYDPRQAALGKRRDELAPRIFSQLFSPEDQKRAAKVDEGWMPRTSVITVEDGEEGRRSRRYAVLGVPSYVDSDFRLPFSERHPAMMRTTVKAKDLGELRGEVEQLWRDQDELENDKQRVSSELRAQLSSFKYVEDLVAAWPEASSVVHELIDTGGQLHSLPALTTLNAALDLPPGPARG